MPRFIERIPHADASRVIPTVFGDIEVVAHTVETDVADAIHWLERNGFARVHEAVVSRDEAPVAETPHEDAPHEDAPASTQEKA